MTDRPGRQPVHSPTSPVLDRSSARKHCGNTLHRPPDRSVRPLSPSPASPSPVPPETAARVPGGGHNYICDLSDLKNRNINPIIPGKRIGRRADRWRAVLTGRERGTGVVSVDVRHAYGSGLSRPPAWAQRLVSYQQRCEKLSIHTAFCVILYLAQHNSSVESIYLKRKQAECGYIRKTNPKHITFTFKLGIRFTAAIDLNYAEGISYLLSSQPLLASEDHILTANPSFVAE